MDDKNFINYELELELAGIHFELIIAAVGCCGYWKR